MPTLNRCSLVWCVNSSYPEYRTAFNVYLSFISNC